MAQTRKLKTGLKAYRFESHSSVPCDGHVDETAVLASPNRKFLGSFEHHFVSISQTMIGPQLYTIWSSIQIEYTFHNTSTSKQTIKKIDTQTNFVNTANFPKSLGTS